MSGRIEEEGQRSQELRAAKSALEQARKDHGIGIGDGRPGVGPEAMPLRLRWLEGCAAAGVAAWTLQQLRALPAPIAAACRTTASFDTLVIAVDLSQLTVYTAGLCVTSYIEPLIQLLDDYDRHAPLIRTHAAPFTDVEFLSALSRAASSAADLARHLQQKLATQAHIAAHRGASAPLATSCASSAVGFAVFSGYFFNFTASLLQKEALSAGPLPPLVPRLAAALRDSQLPSAVARAVMASACPPSTAAPGQGGGGAGSRGPAAQTGASVWPAVPDSVRALAVLTETAVHLHGRGGAAALGARSAVVAALAHPHVASLRLALLQTLWEQAGVGPGPGAGWELENEGAPASFTHHSNTFLASLVLWMYGRQGMLPVPDDARLPPEPGVPPDLQLARAAARTAEAMCRLSRGQGLAGAYTAYQRRLLFKSKSCLSHLLPNPLPRRRWAPEELPHLAEAGAWGVAAALEGLEAAVLEEEPSPQAGAIAANLATTLVDGVQRVFLTACVLISTPPTASQREALAASLRRAGLGASLDHALRLAFAAADRAAAPGASEGDRRLADVLGQLMPRACDLLSALTPPCESAAACDVDGVALTLAKRASLVERGLKAAEAADGPAGAVPGCLRGPRDSSPGDLAALLGRCGARLRRRWEGFPESGGGPAAEPAPASHGPAGGDAPEDELEAYFYQAAGRLAAQLGADAAARALTLASSEQPPLCMPTRIGAADRIAAACKLLLAWRSAGGDPREVEQHGRLQRALSLTALRLAAHPSLSARVRRWLVPAGQWEAAVGCGASSVADAPEGTEGAGVEAAAGAEAEEAAAFDAGAEAEQGCLVQAWGEGWKSYDDWRLADGSSFSPPLTLLHLAQGGWAGERGAAEGEGADAAFRSGAMELLAWAESVEVGGSPQPPQLSEGLVQGPGDASSPEAVRSAAAALRAPLPPPLAAPPEGRAFPKLRVCGFPGCASFGSRSEGDLQLKQCGGCRAVRYCGSGCQRAHWREGHRGECGALAVAAEAQKGASGDGE
ncbi:hypothetical protein HYH03_000904 [Edaphochlamys debaryana]|uniref:MYND-type domain-containing protein n=1 Tax=Edaphochlamys debaryana TaxID=47281 RepID=A0A836C5C4_9CHLO|nr:hypothetical protein HYH03_000904 [Edaphochlamys debaryana]|eukprot:KAG2501086.1 hypothetical protein HYH03_000904 [Edaphochlamys debaryana]